MIEEIVFNRLELAFKGLAAIATIIFVAGYMTAMIHTVIYRGKR